MPYAVDVGFAAVGLQLLSRCHSSSRQANADGLLRESAAYCLGDSGLAFAVEVVMKSSSGAVMLVSI